MHWDLLPERHQSDGGVGSRGFTFLNAGKILNELEGETSWDVEQNKHIPVLYLYRHGFECLLKSQIIQFTFFDEDEPVTPEDRSQRIDQMKIKTHSLRSLFDLMIEKSPDIEIMEHDEKPAWQHILDNVDILDSWIELDGEGTSLRYPKPSGELDSSPITAVSENEEFAISDTPKTNIVVDDEIFGELREPSKEHIAQLLEFVDALAFFHQSFRIRRLNH